MLGRIGSNIVILIISNLTNKFLSLLFLITHLIVQLFRKPPQLKNYDSSIFKRRPIDDLHIIQCILTGQCLFAQLFQCVFAYFYSLPVVSTMLVSFHNSAVRPVKVANYATSDQSCKLVQTKHSWLLEQKYNFRSWVRSPAVGVIRVRCSFRAAQ